MIGVLFVALAAAAAAPQPAPADAAIAGVVRAAGTNAPIRDAQVAIPLLGRRVVTDSLGRFRMANVPTGQWRVESTAAGYAAHRITVLLEDSATLRLDFELPRTSVQAGIRGRITDAATGAPMAGAFVVLLDETATLRLGAVLSNESGGYIINVPAPGRYVLRVERIGYENALTPVLTVAADVVLTHHVEVRARAIVLAAIDVTGEERCRLRGDIAGETLQLWEESRKALEIAAWLEQRGVPYQAAVWSHTRDVNSLRLLDAVDHDRRVVSGAGRSPFVSRPAEDLAEHGFVRHGANGSFDYYGIDAHTLLSDAFLDTHCFRVRRAGGSDASHIGLSFEPVPGRTLPDVAGTLWLDRNTLELRNLEFRYTGHLMRGNVPPAHFGGSVTFRRLAQGAWIVDRWWIRMPQFVQFASSMQDGLKMREEGGAVRFIADAAGDVGDARIEGIVRDARGRPLAGARVFLSGSTAQARSSHDGWFRLDSVPAGTRHVAFAHADLDRLAAPIPTRPVVAVAGETTRVELAVPPDAACPVDEEASPGATIVGFVIDADDAEPRPRTRVTARWEPTRGVVLERHRVQRRTVHVETDEYGRFLICGVPPDHVVRLRAGRGLEREIEVYGAGVFKRDLVWNGGSF